MYFLKVILCSGILFGYYYLFLRNKRFHHYNRFYLLAALALSMVLPLIRIHVLEEEGVLQQVAYRSVKVVTLQTPAATSDATAAISTPPLFTLANLFWLVYGAGVFYLLVALARSLRYIQQLSHRYPYEMIEQLKLYQTNEPGTPFSFFRSIYWNEELNFNSSKGQQIFRHELFHVQQRHSADTIAAELITMFGWFNPFFYLIKRELKAIHEFLADQYAASGSNRYQYAELLVQQVMDSRSPAITHPFFQNQLKRRIAMIMQHNQSKYGYWSRVMVLPISVFLFFSVSLYAQERRAEKQAADLSSMDQTSLNGSLENIHKLTPDQLPQLPPDQAPALVRTWSQEDDPREKAIVQAVQQLPVYQVMRQVEGTELDQQLFSQWWVIEVLRRNIEQRLYADKPNIQQLMVHDLNNGRAMQNGLIIKKAHLLNDPAYTGKLPRKTEQFLLSEYWKSLGVTWLIKSATDTVAPGRKTPNGPYTTRIDSVQFRNFEVVYDKRALYTDSSKQFHFSAIDDKKMLYTDSMKFGNYRTVKDGRMQYTDSTRVQFHADFKEGKYVDSVKTFNFKLVDDQPAKIQGTYHWQTLSPDTTIPKLQRLFNKNYRYPVTLLENHGEGSIYYSFLLDEDGSLKNFEVYDAPPAAAKGNIYEIVIVGYANKDASRTLSTEEKQQLMKGEVNRVAAKNTPIPGKYKPTRYYFKATWKAQVEKAASKPITGINNDGEKTYVKVDVLPAYTGGASAWKKYLDNNLQYPAKAKAKQVEGQVVVQFVVNKEGGINDLQAISGPDELKAEAYRLVLNSAANWKPAVQDGQAVRAYMKQPINFKLQ